MCRRCTDSGIFRTRWRQPSTSDGLPPHIRSPADPGRTTRQAPDCAAFPASPSALTGVHTGQHPDPTPAGTHVAMQYTSDAKRRPHQTTTRGQRRPGVADNGVSPATTGRRRFLFPPLPPRGQHPLRRPPPTERAMNRSFWQAGHTPTLLSAFLYFDLSFMVWYLLGPMQVQIAEALLLDTQQRALMVAVPIL